jgi:lysozyme
MYDIATRQLKRDEGCRLTVYTCTAGKPTIGYGRNLEDKGVSQREANQMLAHDIDQVVVALNRRAAWWHDLDEIRRAAVINMAFQLGVTGFLRFRNTIAALRAGDFEQASKDMLDSLWARQTPNRAKRLSEQIRTGQVVT